MAELFPDGAHTDVTAPQESVRFAQGLAGDELLSTKLYRDNSLGGRDPGTASYEQFQAWLDDRRTIPKRRFIAEPLPKHRPKDERGGTDRRISSSRWVTVREIISVARKRKDGINANEKVELAKRLTSWLTPTYYEGFLKCLPTTGSFFDPNLFDEPVPAYVSAALLQKHRPHYRKYAEHAFCAFVDLFRPGELVGWKDGNLQDPELASSLLHLFSSFHYDDSARIGRLVETEKKKGQQQAQRMRVTYNPDISGLVEAEKKKAEQERERKRQKFITLLFDKKKVRLAEIEKEFDEKLSAENRAILEEACAKYKTWPDRIQHLDERGVRYKGESVLAAYRKTPENVIRNLNRWK